MASNPNLPFLLDALFCEEEHWDNGDITETTENCTIDAEGEGDSSFLHHSLSPEPFLELLGQEEFWGDEELSSLLSKEQENELYGGLEETPSLAMARGEAVEWMLKVIGYYSFSALTAVLAVNYLDRFLYSFQSHRDKPWMIQLAAVACLSLAAKVEETEVPLLLDLQVEESKYVFESKTIQRMEILVLSTLEWKMNPVTPLSFLDYITRRVELQSHLCREFLRRCECLILSLISDCRLTAFQPSALATATILYVISSLEPCTGLDHQDQLVAILGTNKANTRIGRKCWFPLRQQKKVWIFSGCRQQPKRVVDVSFSSDSSNDSWVVASVASVSSTPEPLSKKTKSQSPNHEAS
ncbi:UNVERIFIED_CONTAM: Cyclin-D3-3 [Sesamum angustifolium]|uniref:Cyclin-D3-3 n=1 Tax=Sesamum angustifolium TaxID=2727405 RepID=A0AAW2L9W1_9LAMI